MQPLKGVSDKAGERIAEAPVSGRKQNQNGGERPVSLKILADYLGLCPATVSVVLNNVPGRSIPAETRERVRAAARKFKTETSGPDESCGERLAHGLERLNTDILRTNFSFI